jgi:hypothetical protein
MKKAHIFAVPVVILVLFGASLAAQRGVTEISEGTIRTVYIKKPLVGAKGYVVADWEKGEVRVEVKDFPSSKAGYEAFLFEIDVPTYMGKMFVDGDKGKGLVANPPTFEEEVRAEAAELKRLSPDLLSEAWRERLPYKDPAVLERLFEGLRKAGLK